MPLPFQYFQRGLYIWSQCIDSHIAVYIAVSIFCPTPNRVYTICPYRGAGRQECSSPCWSGKALCETRAETAGKVMEDSAAMVPAAHIILNNTHKSNTHQEQFTFSLYCLGGFTCCNSEAAILVLFHHYNKNNQRVYSTRVNTGFYWNRDQGQ